MNNATNNKNLKKDFSRNEYGAICSMSTEMGEKVKFFLEKMFTSETFKRPYDDCKWHRRYGFLGEYLNYDCYDISKNAILVQKRFTHRTKHGTSVVSRDYYLLTKKRNEILVEEAPKVLVVKLSKICPKLGQVINIIKKKEEHPIISAITLRDKFAN